MARWRAVLPAGALAALSLGACRAPEAAPAPSVEPAADERSVYAAAAGPALAAAPRPARHIGRGQPPQVLASLPVRADPASGAPWPPLRTPMIWQIPGARPALAAVTGVEAAGQSTELIEIDRGVVRWRSREPAGIIVGVTAQAIIGAERGTWALGLDGAALWQTESPFLAMSQDAVAVAGAQGKVTVLDAGSGRELMRLSLPEGFVATDVRWVCPARRDVWIIDQRGALHRVVALGAEDGSGAARASARASDRGLLAWTAEPAVASAVASAVTLVVASVEGCAGDVFAATVADAWGRYELLRLARDTGKVAVRLPGVLGHWLQADGTVVVAQAATAESPAGVRRFDAALRSAQLMTPRQLGGKLAAYGDRLLLRAGPSLALVDRHGEVTALAVEADSAALGDQALLTAVSSRSAAHTVARWQLPAHPGQAGAGWVRAAAPVQAPAPLRELAELEAAQLAERPGEPSAALAARDGVLPAAVSIPLPGSAENSAVVPFSDGVIAVLRNSSGLSLTRLDSSGQVVWAVPGACAGEAAVLAADGDLVVCAVRTAVGYGPVTAYAAGTGEQRWRRELVAEQLQVHDDLVLVRGADRAAVLRADGLELASVRSASGGAVPAALMSAGGATLLVSVEGASVVARWPAAGMLPVWAVAVEGVVLELRAAGAHALVVLEGGEAYTLRGVDGHAASLPAEAERWFVTGEGLLAMTRSRVDATAPLHDRPTRLALFTVDGASRWEYDVALPGRIDVLASPTPGDSAVVFGDMQEFALGLSASGPARMLLLPESAAACTWVRPSVSGKPARWVGVSATAARLWVL